MPLAGPPTPGVLARATPPAPHRQRAPFWRGAAGAVALAAWSVVGVLGAALALIPLALQGGPRGRARTGVPEVSPRRLETGAPAIEAGPTARAAGEAYPG